MRALLRAGLVVAVTAVGAVAHAGQVDVFGGYSFTRIGEASYHGWNGALNYGLGTSGKVGLTADVAGHYGSADDTDLSLFTYLAGPRLQLAGGGKLSLYVHLLAGRTKSTAKYSPVSGVDISQSESSTAALVGVSADLGLSDRWGLRLSASYFGVDAEPEWESQPRVSLGLSCRLGGGK